MRKLLGLTLLVCVLTLGGTAFADGPGETSGAPVGIDEGSDVVAVLVSDVVSFVLSIVN